MKICNNINENVTVTSRRRTAIKNMFNVIKPVALHDFIICDSHNKMSHFHP